MALIDGLTAYWALDEASGNAIDTHASFDLTDNATVGSAAGKISNARDFEADNGEYFSHADDASLRAGNVSFFGSLWGYFESEGPVVVKQNSNFTVDYQLGFSFGNISFTKTDDAFNVGNAASAASTGTWYHIVFGYDADADEVFLVVNNGTPVTQSVAFGSSTHDGEFRLGYDGFSYMDGLVDEFGLWIGRVPAAGEVAALYNSGNGLAYPFSVATGNRRRRVLIAGRAAA